MVNTPKIRFKRFTDNFMRTSFYFDKKDDDRINANDTLNLSGKGLIVRIGAKKNGHWEILSNEN